MEDTRAQKSGRANRKHFESLIDLQGALNACVIKYRSASNRNTIDRVRGKSLPGFNPKEHF